MPATTGVTTEINEVADRLRAYVSRFDPTVELASDLTGVVETTAEIERLAAGIRMQAAARVAESGVWKQGGDRSAEEWMARQTHTSIGQARTELGTGTRLKTMPRTADAVRAGKLNPQQANEVTSAAYYAPDAEDRLLDVAERQSLRDLRDAARAARQATEDDAARHQRIRRNRYLRTTTDAEGACTTIRGPASDGALFLAALRPFQAGHFDHNRRTGNHQSYEATAYDAFCTMAQAAHGHVPDWATIGSTGLEAMAAGHGSSSPTTGRDPTATSGRSPIDPSVGRTPSTPSPSLWADNAADAAAPGGNGSERRADRPARADAVALRAGPDRPNAHPPGDPPSADGRRDRPDTPHANGGRNAPEVRPKPDPSGGSREPIGLSGQFNGTAEAGTPAGLRPRLGGRDVKVIVRIDHSALVRGHAIDGETVDIAGVGSVPVAAVRELMPDAVVAAIVTKGTDVATVAHLGRGPTKAQLTALEWLMPHCTVAGCPCTVAIQYDHRTPWIEVFETTLANLDGLCTHHHWLKTHHDHLLEPGTGPRRLLPPDHPDHPKNRTAP